MSFPLNAVANLIRELTHNLEEDITFASYFRRYENIFRIEYKTWTNKKKVHLLLRKLSPAEHKKYSHQKTGDITPDETVLILSRIFSEKSSLFRTRYHCLNLTKKANDDYVTYAGIVNRGCERFKLNV